MVARGQLLNAYHVTMQYPGSSQNIAIPVQFFIKLQKPFKDTSYGDSLRIPRYFRGISY